MTRMLALVLYTAARVFARAARAAIGVGHTIDLVALRRDLDRALAERDSAEVERIRIRIARARTVAREAGIA